MELKGSGKGGGAESDNVGRNWERSGTGFRGRWDNIPCLRPRTEVPSPFCSVKLPRKIIPFPVE